MHILSKDNRGAGVGISCHLGGWLDFDSDVSHQPDASPLPSDKAGGNAAIETLGFRSRIQTPGYALKVAIRPGFASYDRAHLTSPTGIHLDSILGRHHSANQDHSGNWARHALCDCSFD